MPVPGSRSEQRPGCEQGGRPCQRLPMSCPFLRPREPKSHPHQWRWPRLVRPLPLRLEFLYGFEGSKPVQRRFRTPFEVLLTSSPHCRRVADRASGTCLDLPCRTYCLPEKSWLNRSSSRVNCRLSSLARRAASATAASWARAASARAALRTRSDSARAASRTRAASSPSSPPIERSVPSARWIVKRLQNHEGPTTIASMSPTWISVSESTYSTRSVSPASTMRSGPRVSIRYSQALSATALLCDCTSTPCGGQSCTGTVAHLQPYASACACPVGQRSSRTQSPHSGLFRHDALA